MNKQDVIRFFDSRASRWDAELIKSDLIINTILDNAEVAAGQDVLDVACGTGVMFHYYLERGAASVTGIDISPEMVKIAAAKYDGIDNVQVVCGDVEEAVFDRKFDRIVVYNAFPHFPEPARLIATLCGMLKEGGRLTVAHGMSREAIDGHHTGSASKVSNGLMTANSLKQLFDPMLEVEIMISNSRMYQVSGVKRDGNLHSHGGRAHSHAFGADHTHDASGGDTPMDELLALMKFMVAHNDAHAQELADLASRLMDAGQGSACDRIMEAVAGFDVANARLEAVLKELSAEMM